jgi:DNA primase
MLSESTRRSLEAKAQACEAGLEAVLPYLQGRGIEAETARTHRLGCGQGDYEGRLAIPYIAADGTVVDIRYRALNGDQSPKYMSMPGSKTHLYSVKSLLVNGDTLFITEGEIDCITVCQLGVAAVGVPGVKNWKPHYRLLMEDYDRVVVLCDGDQAGRDFGREVAERVDGVELVHLPDGIDVNQLWCDAPGDLRVLVGM